MDSRSLDFARDRFCGNDIEKGNKMEKKRRGECCQAKGDHDKLEEQEYLRELGISEAKGDKQGMARAYGNLFYVYLDRREFDKAEQMCLKALDIHKKLDDRWRMARDYSLLGHIYLERGEYDKAEEMLFKELRFFEEEGDDEGLQGVYFNLGVNYKAKGELDKAEKMIQKSLEINERIESPDRFFVGAGYLELGKIYRERSDKEKERGYLQKAVELFKSVGALGPTEGNQRLIEKIQRRIDEL